jgi:NodT family efflux transporter outer membrane factor (OMF) lipoprotein
MNLRMKKYQVFLIGISILMVSSCKTLDTGLQVRNQEIPPTFKNSSDTTSIADINWRNYFSDAYLVGLIDSALVKSYDLQIAFQRVEAVRSEVMFADGRLLPTVDGAAWAAQERAAEYSVDWAGNEGGTFLSGDPLRPTYNDYYLGLVSSWEIDVWGKLKNRKRAALSNYLSSIEGRNFIISNLVAEIAILYYELIANDNQLEVIQQTIAKQEEALEVVKARKEVGQANELEVQQFQAQLYDLKSWGQETLQEIKLLENSINFLLGRFPQPIERNRENLFEQMPETLSAGIPSQLLANRPDIREAELLLQASKFDVLSAKAEFYPSFNINAGVGFKAFNPEFLFRSPESIAYSAVGGLVAQLINRKAIKAAFNSAKANQLEAMYNYQKTILRGYVEVANELSNIEYLQEINSLKQQQREVLIQSVETSSDLYRYGRATYLEVLLAQQNSLETQLELISTTKRQRIATVNIYKALGGGWR